MKTYYLSPEELEAYRNKKSKRPVPYPPKKVIKGDYTWPKRRKEKQERSL